MEPDVKRVGTFNIFFDPQALTHHGKGWWVVDTIGDGGWLVASKEEALTIARSHTKEEQWTPPT